MNLLDGDDLTILVGGKPQFHVTSHKLSISVDTKSVRTKDTNGNKIIAGDVSFSVTGDGLVAIETDTSAKMDSASLLKLVLSKEEVEVISQCTDTTEKTLTCTGKGIMTTLDLSSSTGETATYSYTITGSGTLTPYSSSDADQESNSDNV